MMKSILLGSAAALAISTSAFAADAIYEAPAEPPVAVETVPQFSWAGGYAGILTGYGWADGDVQGFGTESFDGARLGGFVGYNWDLGNQLVVGVEGDLNYDWNEETVAGFGDVDTGLNWSTRARVGYAMDRALLFAAGGYTGTDVNGPAGDDTLHGWTVGGGVDYAVTDRMFTRIEYRYNDFGSGDVGGTDVDFDQHTVNVGLAVKF
jgi:outer membrane immunogenic protein